MKEGLQKRLNNIENKSEKQLELIENKEQKQLRIKSVIDIFDDNLSQKAKNYMLNKLNNQEKSINYKRLNFKRDKNLEFDLRDNKPLKELFKGIYYWKLLIDRAGDIKKEFACALTALEKYKLTKPEHIDDKLKQEDNARRFYNGSEIIINAFKNEIFPFYHEKSQFEDEDKNDIRDENGLIDCRKLNRLITLKERYMDNDLIRKHFQAQNMSTLLKKVFKVRDKIKTN